MTVNSDAHAALADADDVDPRYGGPRQWDQWVKDARKSVLEAVGLFGVGIAAFAFDANSASPRLAGWLFWLVLGFTVWFGFAIINRAFKWREAIRDRRLWRAEADGQAAYDRELAIRYERDERRERFWSGVGKVIAWGVGAGVVWYVVIAPLSDAPEWAKALGSAVGMLAAYTVSTLEEIKKQLKRK